MIRPYQQEMKAAVYRAWDRQQSCLAVMATGLGKTHTAAEIMADSAKRSLFLVHRREIVMDTAARLENRLGTVQVEMAEDRASHYYADRVPVVASVQSLAARLRNYNPDHFDRVIIDEAHHALGSQYRAVMNHFGKSKILGLTATPNRTDNLALESVFERCDTPSGAAYCYAIADATNDGWLCPIVARSVRVEGLNMADLKTTKKGDFSDRELEALWLAVKADDAIVQPLLDMQGPRPGILFASGVTHAGLLAKRLCEVSGDRNAALCITGTTPREERKSAIERFKAGEVRWLTNYGVFTEGFDVPAVALVAMCRPTKSALLLTQMIGRGTRPTCDLNDAASAAERRARISASRKPDCLVVDFVGVTGKHKLATVEDALGGQYSDEVKDYARKVRERDEKDGRKRPVAEQLELAEAERLFLEDIKADDERLKRERLARESVRTEVAYRTHQVDVYGGPVAAGGSINVTARPGGASPKQLNYIRFLAERTGTKFAEDYLATRSARQASGIIETLRARMAVGAS